jgi:hypothetical protein
VACKGCGEKGKQERKKKRCSFGCPRAVLYPEVSSFSSLLLFSSLAHVGEVNSDVIRKKNKSAQQIRADGLVSMKHICRHTGKVESSERTPLVVVSGIADAFWWWRPSGYPP